MKNGVDSPSKGAVVLSVVLPRKDCSANDGGDGSGVKRSLVNGSRRWATAVPFETVPFLKRISRRKFGWFASLGATDSCCSFGREHDHIVLGKTQSESSLVRSGRATVEIPVGIGG